MDSTTLAATVTYSRADLDAALVRGIALGQLGAMRAICVGCLEDRPYSATAGGHLWPDGPRPCAAERIRKLSATASPAHEKAPSSP
jgi:hypothetical protein